MTARFRDRRSGYCLLRVPGMGLSLQSRFVPPVRLPTLPGGGTLCRAYRARAWPRALRGGAVRAPDCARETVKAADAVSPVDFSKVFFAGAGASGEAASGCRLLPSHSATDFPLSSPRAPGCGTPFPAGAPASPGRRTGLPGTRPAAGRVQRGAAAMAVCSRQDGRGNAPDSSTAGAIRARPRRRVNVIPRPKRRHCPGEPQPFRAQRRGQRRDGLSCAPNRPGYWA